MAWVAGVWLLPWQSKCRHINEVMERDLTEGARYYHDHNPSPIYNHNCLEMPFDVVFQRTQYQLLLLRKRSCEALVGEDLRTPHACLDRTPWRSGHDIMDIYYTRHVVSNTRASPVLDGSSGQAHLELQAEHTCKAHFPG